MGNEIIPVIGEVLEDTPPPGLKVSPRLRLSTIRDVKRQMRSVYIEARNGELATAEAGKLIWMLSTLGNLVADADLEERLQRLESERDG